MNLLRFIFSKWFLINIALAIIVVIISFFVVSNSLAKFTHHDEELEVPDFRGLSSDSIGDLLVEKKFKMVIIDSLFDKNGIPGEILIQHPTPGSLVKENRSIYFTINAHNAPNINLPPMLNQSSRQVIATLGVLGMEIEHKKYRTSPYENLILDVLYKGESVAKGAEVPVNSKVTLVIGTNNNLPMISIPDLVNLSPGKADTVLTKLGLVLGLMIDCNNCFTGEDSTSARIYRTSPQYKADKKVRVGSTIDFWVSPLSADSLLN